VRRVQVLVDGDRASRAHVRRVADGRDVTTIEGLAEGNDWLPVQQAFRGEARRFIAVLHARDGDGPPCRCCATNPKPNAEKCGKTARGQTSVVAPVPTNRGGGDEGWSSCSQTTESSATDNRECCSSPLRSTTCGGSANEALSAWRSTGRGEAPRRRLSLLPLMKRSLAVPAVVIDVTTAGRAVLRPRRRDPVAIGDLGPRNGDVAANDVSGGGCRSSRTRREWSATAGPSLPGTIGGQSRMPTLRDLQRRCCARGVGQSSAGSGRKDGLSADEFATGFMETVLAPTELAHRGAVAQSEPRLGATRSSPAPIDWATVAGRRGPPRRRDHCGRDGQHMGQTVLARGCGRAGMASAPAQRRRRGPCRGAPARIRPSTPVPTRRHTHVYDKSGMTSWGR